MIGMAEDGDAAVGVPIDLVDSLVVVYKTSQRMHHKSHVFCTANHSRKRKRDDEESV